MFLLRAAVASQRVLLIDIAEPVPMSEIFMPAPGGIDWTLGDIKIPADVKVWRNPSSENITFVESSIAESLTEQFLVMEGEHFAF